MLATLVNKLYNTDVGEQIVQTLPFRQRTALIQRHFEDLGYRLIAENLECSEGTARAHVYQTLRKLRIRWHQMKTDEY